MQQKSKRVSKQRRMQQKSERMSKQRRRQHTRKRNSRQRRKTSERMSKPSIQGGSGVFRCLASYKALVHMLMHVYFNKRNVNVRKIMHSNIYVLHDTRPSNPHPHRITHMPRPTLHRLNTCNVHANSSNTPGGSYSVQSLRTESANTHNHPQNPANLCQHACACLHTAFIIHATRIRF